MSKPNITRQPGEPLTMENFWKVLYEAYPYSVKDNFCKWIDQFKERENWRELFNPDGILVTVAPGKTEDRSPKFHDLPLALQLGIIVLYLDENKALWVVEFALDEARNVLPFAECLVTQLVTYFKDEHEEIAAEYKSEQVRPIKKDDKLFGGQ